MLSVEALQVEHQLLRRTLSAFQDVLANSQPSDRAQHLYQAVVELLEEHLRKEERVTAADDSQIQAIRRADRLHDHAEAHIVFRDLEALFSAWRHVPTGLLAIHLTRLIDELRECFDDEERRVFPIVEQAQEDAGRIWRLQEFVDMEERGRTPCTSVSS